MPLMPGVSHGRRRRRSHGSLRTSLVAAIFTPMLFAGCIQREMNIQTDPPGAVVYLNDREIGRTPFRKTFLWYGIYDVVVRKDEFETLKTTATMDPPLWQLIPLDVITDFLPLHDEHVVKFSLKPDAAVNPATVVQRADLLRQDLESSAHTVNRAALQVHPKAGATTTQPDRDAE